GPPAPTAVCRRRAAGVQLGGDRSEALARCAVVPDLSEELGRKCPRASGSRWLRSPSRGAPPLCEQPLELVDRDELRTPGQLDDLKERPEPVARRATDPERPRRLAAGLAAPLDLAAPPAGPPRLART